GLGDRVRIVGPARRQRGVSILLEQLRPPIPTAGEQPQSMDEHHGDVPGGIRSVHLLGLELRDRRMLLLFHIVASPSSRQTYFDAATLGGRERQDKCSGRLLAGGWPSGRRRRS